MTEEEFVQEKLNKIKQEQDKIQIQTTIYWKDGFLGESVIYPEKTFINPLVNQIGQIERQDLNVVGFRLNGTTSIELIVAKDELFEKYVEKLVKLKEN